MTYPSLVDRFYKETVHSYRNKHKKLIPNIENLIDVRDKTYRKQVGGIRKSITGGITRRVSTPQIRAATVRQQIDSVRASISRRVQDAVTYRKSNKMLPDKPADARSLARDSITLVQKVSSDRVSAIETALALRKSAQQTVRVNTPSQIVAKFSSPRAAADVQVSIAKNDLVNLAQRAQVAVATSRAVSLSDIASQARDAGMAEAASVSANAAVSRVRQELVFSLTQLRSECETLLNTYKADTPILYKGERLARETITQLKPQLASIVDAVNTKTRDLQTVVLQSYLGLNNLGKALSDSAAQIATVKATITQITNRISDLNTSLSAVPARVDNTSLNNAVNNAFSALNNFSPTAGSKPSRVEQDGISQKIDAAVGKFASDMNSLGDAIGTLNSELAAANSAVANIPGQKAASVAAYNTAIAAAGGNKLDNPTRQSYESTKSTYETNLQQSGDYAKDLTNLGTPPSKEINYVISDSVPRNNAYDNLQTALREKAAISTETYRPNPIKQADKTVRYDSQISDLAKKLTDAQTNLDNTAGQVDSAKTPRDIASNTATTKFNTYTGINLLAPPTRDAQIAAENTYNTTLNTMDVSINGLNKGVAEIQAGIFGGQKLANAVVKLARRSQKTTANNLANAKRPTSNPVKASDVKPTNNLEASLSQMADNVPPLKVVSDAYKSILGIFSSRVVNNGTRPVLENASAILLRNKLGEMRNKLVELDVGNFALRLEGQRPGEAFPPDIAPRDAAQQRLDNANTEMLVNLPNKNAELTTESTVFLPMIKGQITTVKSAFAVRFELTTRLESVKVQLSGSKSGASSSKNLSNGEKTSSYQAAGLLRGPTRDRFAVGTQYATNKLFLKSYNTNLNGFESSLSFTTKNKNDASFKLLLSKHDALTFTLVIKTHAFNMVTNIKATLNPIDSEISALNSKVYTTVEGLNLVPQRTARDNASTSLSNRESDRLAAQNILNAANSAHVIHIMDRILISATLGGIDRANSKRLITLFKSKNNFKNSKSTSNQRSTEGYSRADGIKNNLPSSRQDARVDTLVKLGDKPASPDRTQLDAAEARIRALDSESRRLQKKDAADEAAQALLKKRADMVAATDSYKKILDTHKSDTSGVSKDGQRLTKDTAFDSAQKLRGDLSTTISDKINANREAIRIAQSKLDQRLREMDLISRDQSLTMYDKDGRLKDVRDALNQLKNAKRDLEDSIRELQRNIDNIRRQLDNPKLSDRERQRLNNELNDKLRLLNDARNKLNDVNRKIKDANDRLESIRRELDALNKLKNSLSNKTNNLGAIASMLLPLAGLAAVGLGSLAMMPLGAIPTPIPNIPAGDTSPDLDTTTTINEYSVGYADGCRDGQQKGSIDGQAAGIAEARRQYYAWKGQTDSDLIPTENSASANNSASLDSSGVENNSASLDSSAVENSAAPVDSSAVENSAAPTNNSAVENNTSNTN